MPPSLQSVRGYLEDAFALALEWIRRHEERRRREKHLDVAEIAQAFDGAEFGRNARPRSCARHERVRPPLSPSRKVSCGAERCPRVPAALLRRKRRAPAPCSPHRSASARRCSQSRRRSEVVFPGQSSRRNWTLPDHCRRHQAGCRRGREWRSGPNRENRGNKSKG